ncbi:MAG: 4Fe-4S dicluster domain-containing protein [Candidatus Lokiarchaeota archaeon]|nr:4Fe-4S dicluster domain-containing protein [Candidatus Lokiarchaeota archaeon]
MNESDVVYVPVVNMYLCNGCGDCARSCPIDKEPKNPEKIVLKVINGIVNVLRPELCDGCGLCVESCPQSAIVIKFKE